jgi:hypothetical protein
MNNINTIFSSIIDTLTGGVTVDLMTAIMGLLGITIIILAYDLLKDMLNRYAEGGTRYEDMPDAEFDKSWADYQKKLKIKKMRDFRG